MGIIDAFLLFTIINYYIGALIYRRLVKVKIMNFSIIKEKIAFVIQGTMLLLNLLLDIKVLWFIYGILWSAEAGLSYLGEVEWIVKYERNSVSEAAQIAMWMWDALIAISCFIKTGKLIFL